METSQLSMHWRIDELKYGKPIEQDSVNNKTYHSLKDNLEGIVFCYGKEASPKLYDTGF